MILKELNNFLEEIRLEKEKYNFVRASGDCVCEICGRNYYKHMFTEHRDSNDEPFLNKLCDGRIVKL